MRKRLFALIMCALVFCVSIVPSTAVFGAGAVTGRSSGQRQQNQRLDYQGQQNQRPDYGNNNYNNRNYNNNSNGNNNGGYRNDTNGNIDWSGDYYSGNNSYVIDGSDTEVLDKSRVKDLSDEVLRLALNEIYARHGRKFNSAELQEFFNGKDWYTPRYEPAEFDKMQNSLLNDVEKKNIAILAAERDRRK